MYTTEMGSPPRASHALHHAAEARESAFVRFQKHVFTRRSRRARALPVALSLAALLAAIPAQAEPAANGSSSKVRYTRSSSEIKARARLDTRFRSAVDEQKRRDARGRAPSTGAAPTQARALKRPDIANQQIKQLQRLIKTTELSAPEYPDLIFRLADHQIERKAYHEHHARSLDEAIYRAGERGQKVEQEQLQARQRQHETEARRASEAAVKLYQHLTATSRLRGYARLDEAYYFLAFELGQLDRADEMKRAYVRLIQDFPHSRFIANAYLSFADYYFAQANIQDALRLYEKVLSFKDSPVYAYALYRVAWCHLNPIGTAAPRHDLSLQYFIDTIAATNEGRAGSEANARQLRRDARRDLVQAYVHVGSMTRAHAFFQKHGDGPTAAEDMSRKMLELLAVRYFGSGKYTESTFTYRKLQELYPDDAATCEWQSRVVINALASDRKDVQWREAERLGERWRVFQSGAHSKAVKRKCRDEAHDTLTQMATVWHDEAEKTRDPATYDLAEEAYRELLALFPGGPDHYEMQLYYAELLWAQATNGYGSKDRAEHEAARRKFRAAHDAFVKVLELDPQGKHTQDAAYAQMLAMKNYLEYDETRGQGIGCTTNAEGRCVARPPPLR